MTNASRIAYENRQRLQAAARAQKKALDTKVPKADNEVEHPG